MKFIDKTDSSENERISIKAIAEEFSNTCGPHEKTFLIQTDYCTNAFYAEVHMSAKKLITMATIDVPLDPEEQGDYRANRELVEDNNAFLKMKDDAKLGRTFTNIIAEYNVEFDSDLPIKIIGGQHRFIAIKEAFEQNSVNQIHGLKIYFGLNSDQRLDVQLISNTNIVVSSDLLDRMFETIKGPELRNWCQIVGLLDEGQDFADKKHKNSPITVRLARSFILSYLEGRIDKSKKYENVNPKPIITKTGRIDEDWETVRSKSQTLWKDKKLIKAGKQFAKLHKNQISYFKEGIKVNLEFATKAFNLSILSSWAYIAGLLEDNNIRQIRHFSLSEKNSHDPLNSAALAKGKHKTDPQNYRGLGTRADIKERGRLSEVFYIQAEKGGGITSGMVDLGIKKYHAKLANLEVLKAENKMN